VEALTDREGEQANTLLEKEERLRREVCPLNDDDQYEELPLAGSAHTPVTEEASERGLYSQSITITPRRDKLSFGAIRLLWKWDKKRLMRLMKAAI